MVLADGTPQLTLTECVEEIRRVRAVLALDALEAGGEVRAMYLVGTMLMVAGRDLVFAALGRDQASEFFREALQLAEEMRASEETLQ